MLLKKGQFYDVLRRLARLTRGVKAAEHDRVVIVADGGMASMTATDGTSWMRGTLPCEGTLRACVPLRDLRDFVKPVDAADRETRVELLVVSSRQVVVAAECMMSTLEARSMEDVPAAPAATAGGGLERIWDAAPLKSALRWVLRAVCTDASRPHMCGVYFDDEAIVATDGHRMHMARAPGIIGGALLRASDVQLLVGSLPANGIVEVVRSGDWVHLRMSGLELTCPVVPETFPPYLQVVPAPNTQICAVEFERAQMLRTLKRLPRTGADVRINGAWEFKLEENGTQAAVPNRCHTGPEITFRVDTAYLRDALEAGAKSAKATFSAPLDPITVCPDENLLAVVMPQRS